MNWIKKIFASYLTAPRVKSRAGPQQKHLFLLATLPCIIVAVGSLWSTNLSGYLIAFILIVLMLLVSYAIVASRQASEYQVRTLSNIVESMLHGDYSMRGRIQSDQAFHELLTLVNRLADTLSQHKLAAEESRLLLERILEQMDAMVVAINEQHQVVMANASATKIMLNDVPEVNGLLLSDFKIGALLLAADSGIVDIQQPPLSGEYFLLKENFLSDGKPHQLFIVTNAERLLMEKERQAWQGLLRVLSHEMNNSLTPISAVSQSMKRKLQGSQDSICYDTLLEGVNIINERANALGEFIGSYSQLSHLPKPNKERVELSLLIERLMLLFPNCQFKSAIESDLTVEIDKNQLEQVLINVFKNAEEAMNQSIDKVIEIRCHQEMGWQHISIKDCGKGIANIENIFVPFYTTKPQGSGIGLVLCRQILFNHQGMFKIRNRDGEAGVEVSLSLPVK